eukprot:365767-Chlamydomonas_euryale.AAC.5
MDVFAPSGLAPLFRLRLVALEVVRHQPLRGAADVVDDVRLGGRGCGGSRLDGLFDGLHACGVLIGLARDTRPPIPEGLASAGLAVVRDLAGERSVGALPLVLVLVPHRREDAGDACAPEQRKGEATALVRGRRQDGEPAAAGAMRVTAQHGVAQGSTWPGAAAGAERGPSPAGSTVWRPARPFSTSMLCSGRVRRNNESGAGACRRHPPPPPPPLRRKAAHTRTAQGAPPPLSCT